MKLFETGRLGRTIIIELERGEKLIEGICEALEKQNIQNAVILSAIGSIQRLRFHRPTDMGAAANDELLDIEAPMEVGALGGSIIGGQAHFHIVAASPDDIYNGHLELGTEVMYLMEVTVAELEGCNLERKLTPENVKKISIKE
jgi:predicted DNA-binding protein with PD1-like motif